MSLIQTPETIEGAPLESQSYLQGVQRKLGKVPNMFRLISNSPQMLKGYLAFNNALGEGMLDRKTRNRIALAIAQLDGCQYCLSAHTYVGVRVDGVGEGEVAANRKGTSNDGRAAVAVEFAVKLAKDRGQVSVEDVQKVKDAGYSDEELLEIIGHVAINTFTNYVNESLRTVVDFPAVPVDIA
ncbi:carboxymuconolactone decarboxylase family protein [Paraburkholderia pallida]|uniref:Carboxymuconolactone decarboxylase family protein n=1 Tax=Paraburkholderia pallida TaxID=2547399 RepID=A0A4P7D905_9BURK|nr:carboxymuconolactone decarboxylase family protein [Paraburkholderia pallida]QBR03680.1 carboxymuconolactone decarboxylase family protein [Paraburkholderia pallida]